MTRQAFILTAAVVLLAALPTTAAEFAAPPKATTVEGGVRITFEVNAPTDVTVDIVNAAGKVVRRLGAAALGSGDPPLPFTKGLAQSIVWDRTDAAGKPVPKGAYRARVRLGLGVTFDRYLGWTDVPPFPHTTINGLAVGPDRSVYVIVTKGLPPQAGRTETRLCVFDKDGRYVRPLSPYPADADPNTLRGVDFLKVAPGHVTPRVYDRVCAAFLPNMRALSRQTMTTTRDGRLVFANGWGTELYRWEPRSLMVMNADGSIPRARLDGPAIVPKGVQSGWPHVALSPDEKTAYVTGLHRGVYLGKPHHVVYRVGLDLDAKSEAFFGAFGKPLKGDEGLNDPRGIATDRDGRIYVSDFGNNRIAVLSPAGRHLADVPLKGPSVLKVHPKTGAIYAVSILGGRSYRLVRINGVREPGIAAHLDLSSYGGVINATRHEGYHPVIALDPHGEQPMVYLGSPSPSARYRLLRVTDEGAGFRAVEVPVWSVRPKHGFPDPVGATYDDRFYCLESTGSYGITGYVFDGATGKRTPWPVKRQYRYAIGRDGLIYRAKWYRGEALDRIDAEGRVVPFSATGAMSEPYVDEWRFRRDNVYVTPRGEIWTLHFPTRASANALVSMIGPDGKMKRKGVISGLQGATSLRVDSRGNLYIADGLRPAGRPYPPEIEAFAKRLRAAGTTPRRRHGEAVEDTYGEAYGSILKFGPDGGEIKPAPRGVEGDLTAYPGTRRFTITGLKATYGRISPMSPPRGVDFSACWCLHPIFDLDGYDRLFVTDAMQFRVRVLDANFNEILAFGRYGSGQKGTPGDAAIPFEFPTYAHASDSAAYITDSGPCAARVVRVRLTYQATQACDLP